jgi:hypothetical protein
VMSRLKFSTVDIFFFTEASFNVISLNSLRQASTSRS